MTETTTEAGATIEIAAATMSADLVSFLVDEFKAAPDVWPKLSEDQQRDVIYRASQRVGEAIRQAVRCIAADGREVIAAHLEQITAKDGIKAVVTLSKADPNRHALLDSVGLPVLIAVASDAPYIGGSLPQPEPDEPELPLADACEATASDEVTA